MAGIRIVIPLLLLSGAANPLPTGAPRQPLHASHAAALAATPESFRPQFQLAATQPLSARTLLPVGREGVQRAPLLPTAGDGWNKLLIFMALIAYQLRRKHHTLRVRSMS